MALLGFVGGGLLGAVAALVGCFAWLRGKHDLASKIALSGTFPPVIIIAIAAPGLSYPAINDISTDLSSPPAFQQAQNLTENAGRDMSYPEKFKDQVKNAYPDLGPVTLKAPPDAVYQRALKLAQAHPRWTITRKDAQTHTFEGVAETPVFHWKDDFIVRIQKEDDGSQVDMRSKSRDGKGDLGANAKRIKAFLKELTSPA